MVNRIVGYFGGKNYMIGDIIKIIEYAYKEFKIESVVDAFGGSAKILLNIPDYMKVNKIYNDLDKRWFNLWNVLKDDEKRKKIVEMILLSHPSEQMYEQMADVVDNENESDINRAFAFIYLLGNSMNGIATKSHFRAIYYYRQSLVPTPINIIKNARKLKEFYVYNKDAFNLIKRIRKKPHVFIYLDPPYVHGGRDYKENDWGVQHLKQLYDLLSDAKAKWLLNEKVCDEVLSIFGKPKYSKRYVNHSSSKRSKRIEGFWANFKISHLFGDG